MLILCGYLAANSELQRKDTLKALLRKGFIPVERSAEHAVFRYQAMTFLDSQGKYLSGLVMNDAQSSSISF